MMLSNFLLLIQPPHQAFVGCNTSYNMKQSMAPPMFIHISYLISSRVAEK